MTLKITIQTDFDFTPRGKRRARIVETSGRFGKGRLIRWYVGRNRYGASLPVTPENIEKKKKKKKKKKKTKSWLNSPMEVRRPQPWSAFH